MKKDYNKMKKIVIMVLAAIAACLLVGVCVYLVKIGRPQKTEAEETETITESTEISVPDIVIPTETEDVKATESTENTENTVETEKEAGTITSGQNNTSKAEAEAPAEKPKVSDAESITNPEKKPEYENEVTQPQPEQPQPEQPAGGSTNEAGQVYVPGFGYIDDPGQAQGGTADSDGDWNKQIGDMN